ncbi:MAG: NAD(P)H-hydrate epimerase [Anaerovoracaceae bacterium]|nr:NAD(P)H-hydrate epimerase [Anaerovoracaceae bacterium]
MKKNGEHFVTCGQMKLLERRADESGLSYYQMMENAGTGAASMIMERAAYFGAVREDLGKAAAKTASVEDVVLKGVSFSEAVQRKESAGTAYIFCGKGNNGGDGFVVARRLHERDYDVTVILVDGKPKTEDAVANYQLLKQRRIHVVDMVENSRALIDLKKDPDIIVDAIYGTGFKGKLSGNGLKTAIYINRYSRGNYGVRSGKAVMVAALDIPSGMGGDLIDKRALDTNAVTADITITFHARKPVHVQSFAKAYCGEIIVADIGIDEEKLMKVEI